MPKPWGWPWLRRAALLSTETSPLERWPWSAARWSALTRRVSAHTTPVRAARGARIILLAADGVPSRQISAIVGMHESNVAKWRNRFREKGLKGLEDDPRSCEIADNTLSWPAWSQTSIGS